jgi:hypothetical protein
MLEQEDPTASGELMVTADREPANRMGSTKR